MGSATRYTVRKRRRREGKTNFRRRLELLKGRQNRLVIRKTNKQIILQIVKYEPDGDKVLLTTKSAELKKLGWRYSCKSIPAAYLAGMLLAKNAKEHKVTGAVLDLGLQTPIHGNKLFSALKGVIDGGLNVPATDSVFPSEDRITGKHIASYLEKFKNITTDFENIKEKISK